jgi:hypothetical protein
MLKRVRLLHLYLGLLFAPSIIFFSFSGALQLFGLHEVRKGDTFAKPRWIATLAQVHKDQNLDVAPPSVIPSRGDSEESGRRQTIPRPDSSRSAALGMTPAEKENLALKWYFCVMSIGLIVTTFLGIYMAFKYNRDRRLIWGLLVAGVVIPLAALFLGG